ncbi:MAG: Flp pilus assembly protein CpaB [Actinomycetota bacterium]
MSTLALTRRRISVWRVAAVLAALVTGVSVYSYLSWLRAQVPVAGRLVPMVVAVRDLEPGITLEAAMVTTIKHPERYLPPGAILGRSAVLGRVLAVPVFEGEALTQRKLGTTGGLSSLVPAGMRAYVLPVSARSGIVPQRSDRVDVVVTFPAEVLGEATAATVLRSKEVVAVRTLGRGAGAYERVGAAAVLDREEEQSSVAITLFVTPEEAQRLAMAESLGHVSLVLAPAVPGGEESRAPAPVTPRDLARG